MFIKRPSFEGFNELLINTAKCRYSHNEEIVIGPNQTKRIEFANDASIVSVQSLATDPDGIIRISEQEPMSDDKRKVFAGETITFENGQTTYIEVKNESTNSITINVWARGVNEVAPFNITGR